MRVLELGGYISVGFAGMVLAEQGHTVTKWTLKERDPIFTCDRAEEIWTWLHGGKVIVAQHAKSAAGLRPGQFDAVIDNIRAATWESWGVDRSQVARRCGMPWVALEDELGHRSFDAIAQARSWMEYGPYLPIWAGDTTAGLWMAFKALSARGYGRLYRLGQASLMQKLVEGELVIPREPGKLERPAWDRDIYGPWVRAGQVEGAEVEFKGELYQEPIRDRDWKLRNLRHRNGRILV